MFKLSLPDRDTIFKWTGIQDYALAGFILKNLKKSLDAHGLKVLDAILQELNHPYEAGYHKGFNAWQSFKRLGPSTPPGIKFGMWRKFYADASKAVFERTEFKPIGPVMEEVRDEILERSMMKGGDIEDND